MRPPKDERPQIGEVAAQAGVPSSTIRYYEKKGLLPPPARVSGRRRYGPEVVIALAVIDLAKQAGFSLDEIKTLLYGFSDDTPPPERWKVLARAKLPELDERIQRLTAMKLLLKEGLDCECLRLDDCALYGCFVEPGVSRAGGFPLEDPHLILYSLFDIKQNV